ncbi:MAG TPA: hypothetical protein VHG08_07750 [Longimicrobium sp.]|nr:hypothetical protein [Longimicrobium sp.]
MTEPNGGYKHDPQLRARLQAFSPDEPVVFPFSARLAREHGWTRAFAERVMEEYRRFLYLAMTAGHPVSPSAAVDEAWHLNLTYTRSYWDELCGRVLGRPLHHDPTKGGVEEGAKFTAWYARTLESYRAAFGHQPPRDIWPSPAERFRPQARMQQVSVATHWIIRKPLLPRGMTRGVAGLTLLLLAAACAGDVVENMLLGGVLLLFVLPIVGMVAVTRSRPRRTTRRAHRASGSGDVAWFAGSDTSCGPSDGGDCGDGGGGEGGDGGGGCGGGCGGCGGD